MNEQKTYIEKSFTNAIRCIVITIIFFAIIGVFFFCQPNVILQSLWTLAIMTLTLLALIGEIIASIGLIQIGMGLRLNEKATFKLPFAITINIILFVFLLLMLFVAYIYFTDGLLPPQD